jgi:hypothetical protein
LAAILAKTVWMAVASSATRTLSRKPGISNLAEGVRPL